MRTRTSQSPAPIVSKTFGHLPFMELKAELAIGLADGRHLKRVGGAAPVKRFGPRLRLHTCFAHARITGFETTCFAKRSSGALPVRPNSLLRVWFSLDPTSATRGDPDRQSTIVESCRLSDCRSEPSRSRRDPSSASHSHTPPTQSSPQSS